MVSGCRSSGPDCRSRTQKEVPLGSYELFQRSSLLGDTVWQKIMLGLTMRSYKEVVQQFADAYGLEKSTTCEHFVQASREKLKQLMERSLVGTSIAVMLIDGTIFKGQNLVVAVGIDPSGRKLVLGLRQGATENATVVGALLGELSERGLDFTAPRLYLIDGSKAIRAAIRNYAGDAAFVQRCQVHKIRNVVEHVPRSRPSGAQVPDAGGLRSRRGRRRAETVVSSYMMSCSRANPERRRQPGRRAGGVPYRRRTAFDTQTAASAFAAPTASKADSRSSTGSASR